LRSLWPTICCTTGSATPRGDKALGVGVPEGVGDLAYGTHDPSLELALSFPPQTVVEGEVTHARSQIKLDDSAAGGTPITAP
jgi:hypothetical protein